jgi:Xaa-Pro aminopeptidase
VKGHEVDALARKMLRDSGYDDYQHALGHQLGCSVHDGGAILGPQWERYGNTPHIPLEEGNVLTLELEIMLPGIGCVGLEEDVVVTGDGARFLGPRQTELTIS